MAVYGGRVKGRTPGVKDAGFSCHKGPLTWPVTKGIAHETSCLRPWSRPFDRPCRPPRQPRPHNIIIFVADGLRYGSVEPGNMPNMARLKSEGVDFTNSHSLYPTITTVNASAIATGHYIGDTGDFGNTLYVGTPMVSLKGSTLGFLENDTVLDEMNQKFGGNYLNETRCSRAARAKGWQTAGDRQGGPCPHPGFHRRCRWQPDSDPR